MYLKGYLVPLLLNFYKVRGVVFALKLCTRIHLVKGYQPATWPVDLLESTTMNSSTLGTSEIYVGTFFACAQV